MTNLAPRSPTFTKWAGQFGGPYGDDLDENKVVQSLLRGEEEKCIKMTQHHSQSYFPVEIGVVADLRVNAIASIVGDDYFIGIFRGLVLKVYEASFTVAPRLTSTAETEALGSLLADISLLFVKMHELGHIASGHLGLLNSRFISPALAERRERTGLTGLDEQALEFDADSHAIDHLMRVMTGLYAEGRRADGSQIWTMPERPLSPLFANHEMVFRAMGAAIYTYFHAMGVTGSASTWVADSTAMHDGTHPPLAVRLHTVSAVVAARLTISVSEEAAGRYVEAFVGGLFEAARALGDPKPDHLSPDVLRASLAYAAKLEERWGALVPQLRPFVKAGRLAADSEWGYADEIAAQHASRNPSNPAAK